MAEEFTIKGLEPLIKKLDAMRGSIAGRIMRVGVSKASQIVSRAAKRNVRGAGKKSQRTGLLKKSIGSVVRVYKKSGSVVGIVGPRTGRAQIVQRGNRKPRKHDPAKIAHLVELGHGGPHPAPAHPFLRPALDASRQAAFVAMRDAFKAGIAREARRGKR